jgi:hypothetical protein
VPQADIKLYFVTRFFVVSKKLCTFADDEYKTRIWEISKGRKDEDRRERNRQRHRDKVSKGGK